MDLKPYFYFLVDFIRFATIPCKKWVMTIIMQFTVLLSP
jgi:hypothetical protein